MPGFNIDNFTAELNKRKGLMRSNRFLVTMAPPPVMIKQDVSIFRSLEFWCESVTLPGYLISTYNNKRYTYGPEEKRPIIPVFQPIQCVFNSDGNGDYVNFFNQWLQYIMPHDWYTSFNQNSRYSGSMYEIEYKNNYCTDLIIQVYDSAGMSSKRDEMTINKDSNKVIEGGNELPILEYVVKEAFPNQIYDIPFNWSDNQNIKFQVNFDYIDWVERRDIKNTGDVLPPLPEAPKQPAPLSNAP